MNTDACAEFNKSVHQEVPGVEFVRAWFATLAWHSAIADEQLQKRQLLLALCRVRISLQSLLTINPRRFVPRCTESKVRHVAHVRNNPHAKSRQAMSGGNEQT